MDATGWIAAYAAVVATAALVWEVRRTREAQAAAREAQALKVSIRLGSVCSSRRQAGRVGAECDGQGFDPMRSLVVRVRLATEEVLTSEPYRLGT
jgi:hypothetical protein